VPHAMPPEVLSCWSADHVIVSATVLAPRPAAAVAAVEAVEAVEALVPELTCAPGAAIVIRSADLSSGP